MSNIPNSNNLFDIYKDLVKTMVDISDVIDSSKIYTKEIGVMFRGTEENFKAIYGVLTAFDASNIDFSKIIVSFKGFNRMLRRLRPLFKTIDKIDDLSAGGAKIDVANLVLKKFFETYRYIGDSIEDLEKLNIRKLRRRATSMTKALHIVLGITEEILDKKFLASAAKYTKVLFLVNLIKSISIKLADIGMILSEIRGPVFWMMKKISVNEMLDIITRIKTSLETVSVVSMTRMKASTMFLKSTIVDLIEMSMALSDMPGPIKMYFIEKSMSYMCLVIKNLISLLSEISVKASIGFRIKVAMFNKSLLLLVESGMILTELPRPKRVKRALNSVRAITACYASIYDSLKEITPQQSLQTFVKVGMLSKSIVLLMNMGKPLVIFALLFPFIWVGLQSLKLMYNIMYTNIISPVAENQQNFKKAMLGITVYNLMLGMIVAAVVFLMKPIIAIGKEGKSSLYGVAAITALVGATVVLMYVLKDISKFNENGSGDIKKTLIGNGISMLQLVLAQLVLLIDKKVLESLASVGKDSLHLVRGLAGMGVLIGSTVVVMGMFALIARMSGNKKVETADDFKKTVMGQGVVIMSLALGAMGAVFANEVGETMIAIGKDMPMFFKGFAGLASLIATSIVVMLIMKRVSVKLNIANAEKPEDIAKTEFGQSMLAMQYMATGLGLVVSALVTNVIGKLTGEVSSVIPGLSATVVVMALMLGISTLLSSDKNPLAEEAKRKQVTDTLICLVKTSALIGLCVMAVFGMSVLISLVGPKIFIGIAGAAFIMASVIGISWLMLKFGDFLVKNWKTIMRTIGAISIIIAGLCLAAFALVMLGAVASTINLKPILSFMGMIALIMGALFAIGLIIEYVPGGIVAMLIAVAVVISVVIMLRMIVNVVAKISELSAKINKDNINKLIGSLSSIMGKMLLLSIEATVMAPFLLIGLPGMLISLRTLRKIIKSLKKIQKISLKPEKLDVILNATKESIEKINDMFDGISVIRMQNTKTKMRKLMRTVRYIARIARVLKGLSSMEIMEFDDNGHFNGRRHRMQKEDFKHAIDNSTAMLTSILAIFFENPESGELKETAIMQSLDKVDIRLKRKMRQLNKIVGFISEISNTVKDLSAMEIREFDKNGHFNGRRHRMQKEDFKHAIDNSTAMLTSILAIFVKHSDPDENGNITLSPLEDSDIMIALDKINNRVKRKMRKLNKIVGYIGDMSSVVKDIASLNVPVKWNDEGKPTEWQKLGKEDFDEAVNNASTIVTVLVSDIIECISDNHLEKMKNRAIRKMKKIMEASGGIGQLAQSICQMAAGQFEMIDTDENGHAKLDADGNAITKYISASELPIDKAVGQVSTIITTYLSKMGFMKDKYWQHRASAASKLGAQELGLEGISSLVNTIIELSTNQFPVFELDASGHRIMVNGEPSVKYVPINNTMINRACSNVSSIIEEYIYQLDKVFGSKRWQNAIVKQKEFAAKLGESFPSIEKIVTSLNKMNISTDSAKIAETVGAVIPVILKPISENKKASRLLSDSGDSVSKYFTALSKLFEAVSKITPSAATSFDKSVGSSIRLIDKASTSDTSKVSTYANSVSKLLESVVKITPNAATSFDKSVDSSAKLIDKVNTADTTKLSKLATVASSLAKFSVSINGNFDKLANTIDTKIVTALEKVDRALKELNETLDSLPDKVSNSMSSASSSSYSGGGASETSGTDKNDRNSKNKEIEDDKRKKTGDDKKNIGRNIIGKDINDCIVQADDGTYAIAIIKKPGK